MSATITRLESGVHSDYTVIDDTMHIALIYVPAALRGQGNGSNELRRLLAIADAQHLRVELLADSVFGTSISRLVSWYLRYGFTIDQNLGGGTRVRMRRTRV
jgi:GNAT superfamily N-acetyltransferase